MNKLCFVIGPYAAYTYPNGVVHSERENVARAVALGSLALAKGMVPVIPHITIGCSALLLGEHGHPDADGLARRASYGDGDGGLAAFLGRAATHGDIFELWVLRREDGTMSKGTRAEHDAVYAIADGTVDGWTETWVWWRDRFIEAGLEALWQDAGKPDARFPRWPGDDSLTSAERALARMVEIDQDRHRNLIEERDASLARNARNSVMINTLSRALQKIAHMPHGAAENEAATFAQNTLDAAKKIQMGFEEKKP